MEYLEKTLNMEKWERSDEQKVANIAGFSECNIRRQESLGDGKYRYSIQDGAMRPRIVIIEHALHGNPLKGVANCGLILKDNEIMGLNIDGHCVVRKDIQW